MTKSLRITAVLSVLLNFNQLSAQTLCFNTATNYPAGNNVTSVASSDFNGDGNKDLVVTNQSANTVSVMLGSATGTFGSPTNFSVGSQPSCVISADFNGDGKADIMSTNQLSTNVSLLIGNGAGSFATTVNFSVGAFPNYLATADFNNDGNADIVVTNNSSNTVTIRLGTGTGSFGSANSFTALSTPGQVICADFNLDGAIDLAVSSGPANAVAVLLGNGTGSFAAPTSFPVGNLSYYLTSGDFNNDSKIDLATANEGSNNISVLIGTGTGSFGTATNYTTTAAPNMIISTDVDGDMKADLAMVHPGTNEVSLLLGTGSGSFGAATAFTVGTYPYFLCANDFNNDGRVDLASANINSNNTSVLLNCTIFPTNNTVCFSAPDGIEGSGWSYKDYVIPSGYKIDSVYMDADRPGYPAQDFDFVFASCQGTTVYNGTIVTYPFSYGSVNSSLYNSWIDLTSFNYVSTGMARISLPVNAGAIWNEVCFAISPISGCVPNLSSGLVAQYDFTGNANDASGNGNNGIINGATPTNDRFGNPNSAYMFDGSTSFIDVPHSSSLTFSSNEISVSFWANIYSVPGSGFNGLILSKQSGSGGTMQGFNVFDNTNQTVGLMVSNGGGNITGVSTPLTLNQYHHFVYTYNNGTGYSYLDGVLTNSITGQTATIGANTMNMLIGKANWSNINALNFHGVIDEMSIYGRELSACDIDSLYSAANPIGIKNSGNLETDAISVFPNPASNSITVRTNQTRYNVDIINSIGQTVKSIKNNTSNQIDVSDLTTGFYFLKITGANSSVSSMMKFIKE